MNISSTFARCVLSAIALSAITVVANAQTAAGSDSDEQPLGEIVVTAERRAEKIENVPISMTAVSGDTLQNLGLTDFNDYAGLVPNLALGKGNTGGFSQGVSQSSVIAIRGVAGNNTTSVYLNDTPIPVSADPRAFDLERVEVLRGPQGTLFGDAAMGGTVRFVTREPSAVENYGKVDAEGTYTEHGGGGYSADGTANLVLLPDQVAFRLTAFSAFDPGIYTRTWGEPLDPRSPLLPYAPGTPVGQKDHVGADQLTGMVTSLRITPRFAPGLSITPMLMYQRSNSNGYPLADYTPDNFIQGRPLDVPESVIDTWTFAGLTLRQNWSIGSLIASGTYFHREADDYEDGTEANAVLFLGLPTYIASPLPTLQPSHTWTGEARFESNIRGPIQFVVGGFDEFSESGYLENWYVPSLVAATGGAFNSNLEFFTNTEFGYWEHAAFVDVSYQITKALRVSAGVRRSYLEDDHTGINGGALFGGSFPTATYNRHTEADTAPRYTAKYEIAPSQMVYASAGRGYRVGGYGGKLPTSCQAGLEALGINSLNSPGYDSDTLWSFEVGSKNSWIDNRVQSTLAVYRIDWKDIQQAAVLPCGFSITTNAGYAVSNGTELEIATRPLKELTLNFAVGYEEAKITEPGTYTASFAGQPLQGVPKWTGSIIAQYSVPFDGGAAFLRGDWSYTGSRVSFTNVPPPQGLEEASYSLLNLRLGFNRGPWEAALFARNVFNKLGVIGDLYAQSAEIPDQPRLFVTRPRTIGLQLQRTFP